MIFINEKDINLDGFDDWKYNFYNLYKEERILSCHQYGKRFKML